MDDAGTRVGLEARRGADQGAPSRAVGVGRAKLSPSDMLTFAAVARAGGIRHGARALGVPRSTVSRQLANLEQALGGSLVARSTRRFVLTELGQVLAEQCARLEQVLGDTEHALGRAAREPSGTLVVAASPVVGEELLPDTLAEYVRRFPRVRVDVRLSVRFVDLRREGVDVALRTGPLPDASDLYAVKIGHSLKGLYASRAYLKKRGTPASPEELRAHDCILVDCGEGDGATWNLQTRGQEVPVRVNALLRLDSYRLACSAAAAHLGIARIPSLLAAPLVHDGALEPVLEKTWIRPPLYAVHAAGHPAPPKIRSFIELVRQAMRDKLAR